MGIECMTCTMRRVFKLIISIHQQYQQDTIPIELDTKLSIQLKICSLWSLVISLWWELSASFKYLFQDIYRHFDLIQVVFEWSNFLNRPKITYLIGLTPACLEFRIHFVQR